MPKLTPPSDARTPADLTTLRVAKTRGRRWYPDAARPALLLAAGIAPHSVHGPELASHPEIALAVAAGIADVALGLRAEANDLDLDFIPPTWERLLVGHHRARWPVESRHVGPAWGGGGFA